MNSRFPEGDNHTTQRRSATLVSPRRSEMIPSKQIYKHVARNGAHSAGWTDRGAGQQVPAITKRKKA